MSVEIKVPGLPESVADATVSAWHKKAGDSVKRDEHLVDLETDKVVLEVTAPTDGVLAEILKPEGETVLAGQVIGIVNAGAGAAASAAPAAKAAPTAAAPAASAPAAAAQPSDDKLADLSPAVRRLVSEKGINLGAIQGTGKGGRITKEDVQKVIEGGASAAPAKAAAPAAAAPVTVAAGERSEKRVPMTRLRARIAERLLQAQHSTAMLTTFNEINLQAIMDLRERYKDRFEKQHGVRLGFMSFFTKAAIEALKRFPAVNASIDGNDVVYHGYYDVGIAVSTERGLVVPILRDADRLGMADIEKNIGDYARKARDGKLSMEEMTGGTFTITNGGVFGSLLATPILNPPQSAILGMHKIEQRPMAENGQVVIRPMMYVALSYDHRIIDGKESVGFLVTIKELLEDPARLVLDV